MSYDSIFPGYLITIHNIRLSLQLVSLGVFHGVSYLSLKFVIKRVTLFIIFLYSFSSSALSFRDVS